MKRTVTALCRSPLAAGFRLTGIAAADVVDAAEAGEVLEQLAVRPGTGIIVIEQELLDAIDPELRQRLAKEPLPILVPFSAAQWTRAESSADAYITEILRQAIGYRVRLR